MNKIIPPLPVLTVSTCATAGWVLIHRYSDANVYADPAGVSRVKNESVLRTVTDSRKDKGFMGTTYRSVRTQMEYDCARMTSLHLKSSHHKGRIGYGELYGTVPPAGAYPPGFSALHLQSDRPDEVAWRVACAKQEIRAARLAEIRFLKDRSSIHYSHSRSYGRRWGRVAEGFLADSDIFPCKIGN